MLGLLQHVYRPSVFVRSAYGAEVRGTATRGGGRGSEFKQYSCTLLFTTTLSLVSMSAPSYYENGVNCR